MTMAPKCQKIASLAYIACQALFFSELMAHGPRAIFVKVCVFACFYYRSIQIRYVNDNQRLPSNASECLEHQRKNKMPMMISFNVDGRAQTTASSCLELASSKRTKVR